MNAWMYATSSSCGKGIWNCDVCPLGTRPLFHKESSHVSFFSQNLAASPELLLINHFIGTAGQERTEWVMGVGHRVADKGPSWHGNNRQTDVARAVAWPLDSSENRPRVIHSSSVRGTVKRPRREVGRGPVQPRFSLLWDGLEAAAARGHSAL